LWSLVIAKVADHFDIKVNFKEFVIAVDGNTATNSLAYDLGEHYSHVL